MDFATLLCVFATITPPPQHFFTKRIRLALPLLLLLGACGGGGGGSDSPSTAVRQEPAPPRVVSEPSTPTEPRSTVNLPSLGGSRDTSIKYLFQADLDRYPELEPFLDEAMLPWYDLEFVDDTDEEPGLIRINPASDFWTANPQVDLPNDGEYEFNVERPHKGKGWAKVNENDFIRFSTDAHEVLLDPSRAIHITPEELTSKFLSWSYRLNEAIYTGYHQWLRHLDYDPGEMPIEIKPTEDPRDIAYWTSDGDKVVLGSQWLFGVYYDYVHGNEVEFNNALDHLSLVITHEAAHQFKYYHPNGTDNGCTPGLRCHAPYGSGSVASYDHHLGRSVNYGVTEEDIKHIPNATYNDNPESVYVVTKDSPMGEYGVWITHYFKVTGKTIPGASFGGDYEVFDSISAYGFLDNNSWDDQLPSGSATYSGTDNFVGADMSHHFLGALLRADANLIYQFGSSTSGNMSLTIDDFEVYDGDIWRTQNGSITYRLGCEADGFCGTEDGYTVESWFGSNGQYVGGHVEDFQNEYVGAFVAERD